MGAGLSPRVRGNRDCRRPHGVVAGSIPARAGEPVTWVPCAVALWVYPRACGGTNHTRISKQSTTGLSPRVRGNRSIWNQHLYERRSIPARAGEPTIGLIPVSLCKVYPRACGGTRQRVADPPGNLGLSPRVRGNLP